MPAATVTTTVAVAYTANIGVTRRPRWSHRSKATTKIHAAHAPLGARRANSGSPAVPEAQQATGAGRGQWAQAAHLQHPAAVRVILRYSRIYLEVHQTHFWSRRMDGCKGSCLHLPSPRHRDWVPDRAFRPRQSLCAYRLPIGMVWRFPRHHPATALAGALGCRGSARGRRLWK